MQVYRAAWVLPIIGEPIRDGWVAVEDGFIAGVGGQESEPAPSRRRHAVGCRDLGDVVILPALVNAHTHLELSWLRGRRAGLDASSPGCRP